MHFHKNINPCIRSGIYHNESGAKQFKDGLKFMLKLASRPKPPPPSVKITLFFKNSLEVFPYHSPRNVLTLHEAMDTGATCVLTYIDVTVASGLAWVEHS